MSAPEWQISFPAGSWVTTYRGVRIVIKRSVTGNPIEIGWYIGGRAVESLPVDCDEEWAKKMAVDVVDDRMSVDGGMAAGGKGSSPAGLGLTVKRPRATGLPDT
jgi:hypothetical protein